MHQLPGESLVIELEEVESCTEECCPAASTATAGLPAAAFRNFTSSFTHLGVSGRKRATAPQPARRGCPARSCLFCSKAAAASYLFPQHCLWILFFLNCLDTPPERISSFGCRTGEPGGCEQVLSLRTGFVKKKNKKRTSSAGSCERNLFSELSYYVRLKARPGNPSDSFISLFFSLYWLSSTTLDYSFWPPVKITSEIIEVSSRSPISFVGVSKTKMRSIGI